ncbi:tRNA lysidine(34) synthetase TilS [Burkholderia pseudomallei]|uniref:tRNA lysidine(34) synthetase TilS n=1 Tax=Burkholderia pseudomallei TaxID=28450 RepID=UPI000A1A2D08|nr:tRNA lysidine(34) synthetase TilS [Burkholderia pseudomallei]ARL96933.1 tRNA lysidine(34) synthetase TilS [Burkholderia pseudomallei]MBG1250860.1 tRNA lysidine(34) synthetase TilS [Burkholderia pseudomallei]RIV63062.1 tRNA lysidine(34) synthetase TilS [Burkholderia pseudomallei]RIV79069.1 tRNA lysidine(34) synthetase TilS [Burkholderia pseudomallei]TXD04513.1 tRNA lysidine(34) synthetase TilS [Burkholderia pseudomallei]
MIPPHEFSAERVVFDALGVALSALPDDTPIAIAYSGGLDSTVLLHAAARIAGAGRCIALHVHHGLSANADAWLAHCAETAQALGARFGAARVDVPRASGQGIEASARDARYRALETMCARYGARTLWLAQHADDQAETVLLQLLRGAGIAGLAAMAPQYRPALADVVRMRPLLHLLRAQLERYAQQHALRWIDDESNTDTRYARNALRVDVLPALAPHFPGFRDALARTAQHAAAAQRLLDDLAAIDLRAVARADVRVLSRDALVALDDERGANLLRYWMRSLGLPGASAARLAEMVKQLRAARDAHALRVDHAGWRLRLYRDDVQWEAGDGAASEAARADVADDDAADARDDRADASAAARLPACAFAWRGHEVWRLPGWRGSFVFSPVAAHEHDAVPEALLSSAALRACARAGGERMRTRQGGPGRTLKNLFQERGVPAWQRDVPLLYVGERLLFVPRIGVNRATHDGADAPGGWRRIEWRPDMLIA